MTEKQKDRPNINKNVHPPIVTLLYIIVAIFLGKFIKIPLALPPLLQTIGFVLTFIGFLFGVGAFIEFRKARTTLDPHGSVNAVVTTGVYRITRNPIYFGFLLMLIGIPLNSGYYWGIILSPLFIATINRLIIEREEAYLERKFKEQYTSYKSHVRRWL